MFIRLHTTVSKQQQQYNIKVPSQKSKVLNFKHLSMSNNLGLPITN